MTDSRNVTSSQSLEQDLQEPSTSYTPDEVDQAKLLFEAIVAGDTEVVALYSKSITLVNAQCGANGITPLHAAAYVGNWKILQLLLDSGANVNAVDIYGKNPVFYVCVPGYEQCLNTLLLAGGNASTKSTNQAFFTTVYLFKLHKEKVVATIKGNVASVIKGWRELQLSSELTLEEGTYGQTPLHVAVQGLHLECIQMLLQYGVNINEKDSKSNTPIIMAGQNLTWRSTKAVITRYEQVIKLLIQNRADPRIVSEDERIRSPLYVAVSVSSPQAVKYLRRGGAHDDEQLKENGSSLLHEAARLGSTPVVMELLEISEIQSVVNYKDKLGYAPLHLAAENGDKSILCVLLKNGGDLAATTPKKQTVIDIIFGSIIWPANFILDVLDRCVKCSGHDYLSVEVDFSILAPKSQHSQMAVIQAMLDLRNEKELYSIFKHPVLATFLHYKWNKVRPYFIGLFLIYLTYVLSFSTYVFFYFYNFNRTAANRTIDLEVDYEMVAYVASVASTIVQFTVLIITFYSVMLLTLFPKFYLHETEPWMYIVTALLTMLIVSSTFRHKANAWVKHLASMAILTAWLELMVLMGRFESLGFYGLIFNKALKNVLKVTITFICLIVGFSFSFFLLFRSDENFSDPYHSLVKTIVMTLGEYEYFHVFRRNYVRVTSRIIFVSFVVVASIALMNLMVGLTVSDVKDLEEVAQRLMLLKQADFMSHLEKMMSLKYIEKCLPTRCLGSVKIDTKIVIDPADPRIIELTRELGGVETIKSQERSLMDLAWSYSADLKLKNLFDRNINESVDNFQEVSNIAKGMMRDLGVMKADLRSKLEEPPKNWETVKAKYAHQESKMLELISRAKQVQKLLQSAKKDDE